MTLLGAFLVFILLQLHKGAGEFFPLSPADPVNAGSPPWDPGCCPAVTVGGIDYKLVGQGLALPICLTNSLLN